MRLVGQIHEINVPIPDDALVESSAEGIESDFHQIYQQLYSRRNLSIPIQVQNWRLLVSGPQPVLNIQEQTVEQNADVASALKGSRSAYFPNANGFIDCPVYDRYKLTAGTEISGPAIIEEEESTTVIRPGDSASVDRWLNLLIQVNP
jgi:N-methylhydantoinase A/oxoprolinase/acetone carboxylase beta subunit